MMESKDVKLLAGEGKYQLEARILPVGDDLHVVIYGGDSPHIGAVAVGFHDAAGGVNVETVSIGTHREAVVVEPAADRLASALGKTVVVSAGMHWEQIDSAGISNVLENARLLVEKIRNRYLATDEPGDGMPQATAGT